MWSHTGSNERSVASPTPAGTTLVFTKPAKSTDVLPKSLVGKAATYTRNQWTALNRYLDDGDLSFDNNFAERAMRPIAIGRKNWLFVGSERAGHRAAVLTSLIASCKNNEVEPWAYLKEVYSPKNLQSSSTTAG